MAISNFRHLRLEHVHLFRLIIKREYTMYYVSCHTKKGRPRSVITSKKFEFHTTNNKHIPQALRSNNNYSLLSLLYSYQKITKGMFEAGLFLQNLRYQSASLISLTPLSSRQSSLLSSNVGNQRYSPFVSCDSISLSALNAQKRWVYAEKILRKQGLQSYKDIKKVIIDNELPPHWVNQEKINFKPLQIGLRSIEEEFFYSKA